MDHPIPPIVRATSWKQPDRHRILVNDKEAVMPQEVLDALLKYDTTYPSGVYEGKMWRRTDGDVSFLLWYSNEPNDPDHCRVNYRKIIVFDWAKAMGVKL